MGIHPFPKIKERVYDDDKIDRGTKECWNWNKYLPSSFDAIKISAIEGS